MTKFHLSDPDKVASYRYVYRDTQYELPDSTPQGPSRTFTATSIEQREIAAAHLALDDLGVPAVADVDVTREDDTETRLAPHDLRLHGRIRFLAQRLGDLGIADPFSQD